MPLPTPTDLSTEEEIPLCPLRLRLRTSLAATSADLHAIITQGAGVVQHLEKLHGNSACFEWQVAFFPASLTAAAETLIRLLDLGELSFSLQKDSVTKN